VSDFARGRFYNEHIKPWQQLGRRQELEEVGTRRTKEKRSMVDLNMCDFVDG